MILKKFKFSLHLSDKILKAHYYYINIASRKNLPDKNILECSAKNLRKEFKYEF